MTNSRTHTEAIKALQAEGEFLSGVDAKLESAKGKDLRGSRWQRSEFDEMDRLRALMAQNRLYDRDLLKSLPSNRRVTLQGFERRFFGLFKRQTGVAVASVLTSLEHFASGSTHVPPPIGLAELTEHVRKLVGNTKLPHLIGVCSPTGFTPEARSARWGGPNVTLILVEPDGSGGWRTTATAEATDPRVLKLFDPEDENQKVQRLRSIVEEHSAELLTGGLTASTIARKTNLSEDVVRRAFEQAARTDPELKVSHSDGEFLLFRGAPMRYAEKKPMNFIERIKQLFSREGEETAKVNLLAERRAALAQRRDRIYDDISKLEKREADLFAEGKAATSQVPRRRLAAQLAQLRKDIGRQNATSAMLNQQINILSTHIHNLTLLQQGKMAELPDTEELTENAVAAEELLESLKADSDLVGDLETGIEETLMSQAELEILREFEASDEKPRSAAEKGSTAEVAAEQPQKAPARSLPPISEEPRSTGRVPKPKSKSPDAEAT